MADMAKIAASIKIESQAYWLRVFAGQAMQGMIANPVTKKWWRKDGKDYLDETIAGTAVRCAKVLLDAIEDYEKEAAGE